MTQQRGGGGGGDIAARHRAKQSIAGQIARHVVARHAARGAAGSQQIRQGLPIAIQHAALRIDVQAALRMEQRAGDLDGVVRRLQGALKYAVMGGFMVFLAASASDTCQSSYQF
ncbi:hypothetical protein D3C87_1760650 [compost metagenome]